MRVPIDYLVGTPIAYYQCKTKAKNKTSKAVLKNKQVNDMRSNYTLKQAVITALTMLAIGTQNQALALGLGNIEVKSHLGQPLRASIKIQGANELKSDTCFRVINDSSTENQLTNANFKLSKIVDDVAILTVTTDQGINEPIVNLSVIAECDANMRRDYVLLLDPLLTAEVENSADEMPSNTVDKASAKEISTAELSIHKQTVKAPLTSIKTAPTKKQKYIKKTNENIVLTTGYNVDRSSETTVDSTKNDAEKPTQPRLSISGGDASNMNLNSTKLRLDRQLHFTPETNPQAFAADIEIQDEMAVMNNRLAHLKQQIDALAQANLKLKNENQLKTQQLNEANSLDNKLDFIGYILGGGLLLASFSIADKLRRRRQIRQLENAQLAWVNNSKAANNFDTLEGFDTSDVFFEPDLRSDSRQEFNRVAENSTEETNTFGITKDTATPFTVEEFNSENNVLDHADVFLSHGRTSLAIQLLQNHLLDFPKQSVTIWMYLLDLLAKENLQAMYEQTALECKEHFNIKIAAFSKTESDSNHSLESFPRITSGLQQLWGTPAALIYLDDLIYNSRLEIRVGFHKNVIEELLLLRSVAQEELKTAEVIQMDEKKLAMKELKEARLAAKREEKLKQMDELPALKELENQAPEDNTSPLEKFEFNLVEFK
ncbi:MAG: hypothetical protein WBL28_06880 [Methylotenera sp.]